MKRVSVTPGMARAMKRLGVHTACTECGFHVPVYVGRYPNVCPGCGHTFKGTAHGKVDSKIVQRALLLLEELGENEALLRKVYGAYEVKGEPEMSETKVVRSPDRKLQAEGLFYDEEGYHVELSVRDDKGSRLEKAFGARPDLRAWLELIPFVDADRAVQILESISSRSQVVEAVSALINREANSYWGEAHLVYEQRDCCSGTLTVYVPEMYNVPLETMDLPPTSFKRESRKRFRADPGGWERWEAFGGHGGEDHEFLSVDPNDFEVDVKLALKRAPEGGENQFSTDDMVEVRIPGFNIITIMSGIVGAWLEGMSQGNMTDPGIENRTVRVTVDEVFELMARAGQFLDDFSTGEGTGRITTPDHLLQYLRITRGTVPRLEQDVRGATGEPLLGRLVVFRSPSGAMVEGEVIGQDGGIIVVQTPDGSVNTVDIENIISSEVKVREQDDDGEPPESAAPCPEGQTFDPDTGNCRPAGGESYHREATKKGSQIERGDVLSASNFPKGVFGPPSPDLRQVRDVKIASTGTIFLHTTEGLPIPVEADQDVEVDEARHRETITLGSIGMGADRPIGKPQRAPTIVKRDGSLGVKGATCPPGFVFDFSTNECVKEESAAAFLVKNGLLPLREGSNVWLDGEKYRILQVHEEGRGVDLIKMDSTATILRGISPLNLDEVE